jgi:DNA-directed RNA polymerase subunit RPC12/RpoP
MYKLKCIMCGREVEHRRSSLMCSCGNLMYPKPQKKEKREVKHESDN